MRTGAMVLGIIGGLYALSIGLLGFTLGQGLGAFGAANAVAMEVVSLGLPIAALVGAGVVGSRPMLGGMLMVGSALASCAIFGVHFLSLLPGIPLLIAGILGVMSANEQLRHPAVS
jgi:hypothetical protein